MTELSKRGSASPVPADWTYAPAPESRDIVSLQERYGLFVGGEWVEPLGGESFTTISPRDEEPLAEVAQAGAEDVTLAVAAAREAFGTWSALPGSERAKYLFRIARILQERAREFAVLESLNGGKPIKESRDVDLPLAAAHFFYYAGWADKLEYAFPNRSPRPLGVAGQIIPWNFPLLMLAWKLAPALAAGNTVVLKPAETTPLTALLFCDVVRQAELPPGVVNIVTGDGRPARRSSTPSVDKIAFTGSTEVGKAIQRRLAGTGKKLTLELGGKAANIVFDDAALDQAVEGIVNGIYFNQGHVCCAGSRLFVQESIAEPAIEKLKRRMATLRVGDPLDKNTDVGAINSRAQLEKIKELVAAGSDGGRRDLPAAVPAAREGLLVRADRLHERRAELPDRAGGDLRPGALGAHVPHARGGGREGEQHALRPLGRRLDGEGLADPLDGRAAARRRRLGEHVQPLRPGAARSAATRSPGSAARAAGTGSSRTSRSTATVIEVRPAAGSDEEALAAIDRATWSWLTSPAPAPGRGWRFFDDRTRPEDVQVALDDGDVAGYVRLQPVSPLASTSHVLQVNGIAVDPARQRRGVGRALIDAAVAEARRRGARRLTLRVLGANAGARRLYESAGFAVEGVLRGQFFLDGAYVDDVFMALELAPVK